MTPQQQRLLTEVKTVLGTALNELSLKSAELEIMRLKYADALRQLAARRVA